MAARLQVMGSCMSVCQQLEKPMCVCDQGARVSMKSLANIKMA